MATEILTCNFIGEFKVGDNMERNAKSLCKLGVAIIRKQARAHIRFHLCAAPHLLTPS